jgi:hypothetical protein
MGNGGLVKDTNLFSTGYYIIRVAEMLNDDIDDMTVRRSLVHYLTNVETALLKSKNRGRDEFVASQGVQITLEALKKCQKGSLLSFYY